MMDLRPALAGLFLWREMKKNKKNQKNKKKPGNRKENHRFQNDSLKKIAGGAEECIEVSYDLRKKYD